MLRKKNTITSFCYISLLSVAIYTLTSCATMFAKKQTIQLDSSPQGAKVYAGSKYVGTTPCTFTTKAAKRTLTFVKEGYATAEREVSTVMRGEWWLNWFNCFYPGMMVDWISGSVWKYPNNFKNYSATLIDLSSQPSYPHTPQPIVVKDTPSVPREQLATSAIISQIKIAQPRPTDKEMKKKDIYKKYNSAVFMIFTEDNKGEYQGSGFFVSPTGIAVSNYHNFQGTYKGLEIIKTVDGKTYKVKEVLAYSEKYDYILFRVDGNGFNYIPVTKRKYEVAEDVVAIGSPKGLENTFSEGTISQIRSDDKYKIQINVPIDHGSSGGALINMYGEVIGITSAGRDDSGANLNFAQDIKYIFNTNF